jgi:hypothetical protein
MSQVALEPTPEAGPEPGGAEPAATPVEKPPLRRVLATLFATLAAAAVLLVVVVLPAEYQLDPTGLGRLLGLDRLRGEGAEGSVYLPEAEAGVATEHDESFRTETVTVPIGAREEIEYKVSMGAGSTVVFSWRTDRGELYADFHAEPFNDLNDQPIRYHERAGVNAGHGTLRAPFAGHHGWYWRNENDFPVTITLQVAGYFTGFRELHRAPLS